MALLHLRGRLSSRWLVLAGVVLGLTKVNNLLVLGVAAAIVTAVVLSREIQLRPGVRTFLLVAVPACVTYGFWRLISRVKAEGIAGHLPVDEMFKVDSINATQVWNAMPAAFPPSAGIVGSRFLLAPFTSWAAVIGWLLIGGTFLAMANRAPVIRGLGWGTFVTALLMGPFLVVTNFVLYDEYYDIPPRYGMVLIPAMLAGLATSLSGRRGRVIALAIAAAGLLSYLWVYLPHRP